MILFYHIPKTGGTYISHWISSRLSTIRVIPESKGVKKTFFDFKDEKTKLAFFFHSFDPFEMIPKEKFDFKFTIIRNPFEMFKSFYMYYRSGRFVSHNIETMGKVTMDWNNNYIASILKKTYNEYVDEGLKSKGDYFFPKSQFSKVDLEEFDFVGLAEYMNHSLEIVSKKIGIDYSEFEHKNVTPKIKIYDFFEYRKEDIIEYLKEEFEIYEKFKEKFEVQSILHRLHNSDIDEIES